MSFPDGSGKSKKSPLMYRPSSSPPKIIKQSLKNFSGLEGVTPGMLSTQDSLEVVQKFGGEKRGQSDLMARRSVHQEMSMPSPATMTMMTSAGLKMSAAEASSVFHRVGRAAKKHSLDEEFFVGTDLRAGGIGLTIQQNPSPKGPREKSGATFHEDTVDSGPVSVKPLSRSGHHHHHQSHHHSSNLSSTGRSSLTIGIGGSGSTSGTSLSSGSTTSGRSCSLSDEAHTVAVEQRRRLQALSTSVSHAGMATSASASGNIAQSSSLSHSLPATILNLEDNKVKIQVPGLQQQQQQQSTASRTHSTVSKQTSLDKGDYSGDLNTELVWYLNGGKEVSF